jgi:hypothetical protein
MIDGDRKWNLSRNKTHSEDFAEVFNSDAMQKIIRPILERIKERGETIAVRLNQNCVQTILTKLLETAKVILTDEDEMGGERGGDSERSDGGGNKRRKKKRRIDPLSDHREKMQRAESLQIFPHEDARNRGLGFVAVSQNNTIWTIYIDQSTQSGKSIWSNRELLLHYAIIVLGQYLGINIDIHKQLRLPIGDIMSPEEVKFLKRVYTY